MPIETRRKSLSLPSLGIQLPGKHSSARVSHHNNTSNVKSTPALSAVSPSTTTANAPKPNSPSESPRAAKRVKRSHTLNSIETLAASAASPAKSPISLPSRSRKPSSLSIHLKHQHQQQLQQQRLALLGTPPPSPSNYDTTTTKLDLQGINDDIVVAVLQQLEITGNRPHLIKELAAILVTSLASVESSQNPVAIISSRLTNYLKRPWTALAPCPLTKEQVTVHPRRVYYYLTTMPRQEIPEYADTPLATRHIISPSISSGPDEEEEMQVRTMTGRSPSPEVDFSTHDDDDDDDLDNIHALNGMSFSEETYALLGHLSHTSSRLASPPLEHDEREFTQTASVMQQRKESEQAENEQKKQTLLLQQQLQKAQEQQRPTPGTDNPEYSQDGSMASSPSNSNTDAEQLTEDPLEEDLGDVTELPTHNDDYDHQIHLHDDSSNAFLFGQPSQHNFLSQPYMNSPVMRPQPNAGALFINTVVPSTPKRPSSIVDMGAGGVATEISADPSTMFDAFSAWGELKSPENVELAELDDMFGNF